MINNKRYSNSPIDVFEEIPGSDDYTELPPNYYESLGGGSGSGSGLGQNSSGSGLFGNLDINQAIGAVTNIVNSIWGKEDKYRYNTVNALYEKEQQINTILWVVVGLVVALGVFLLVRKTK